MIIKLFLIGIILYIIINQFIDNNSVLIPQTQEKQFIPVQKQQIQQVQQTQLNQPSRLEHDVEEVPQTSLPKIKKKSEYKVQEFDKPYPWTKVIYNEDDEFPYYFHIRITIPSLNDFEKWKQIIPNLDFNPNSGELIIPSKEEASALAVANLICINFSGQMTIENILNKDLIRISIHKSLTHEVVRNKLREQIMEVLYGKPSNNIKTNYEEDLAKNNNINNNNNMKSNEKISLKSEHFRDTFQHFSDHIDNSNEISAYDSNNYSFI
jgi:hypothetical protein